VNAKASAGKKFLADRMLGRLAKWLRILGYDTLYLRATSRSGLAEILARENRLLLTRAEKHLQRHGGIHIHSDHLKDQLKQLVDEGIIDPDPAGRPGRCAVCNSLLEDCDPDAARDHVPEFTFFEHMGDFKRCPTCGRFYWQGSHCGRMDKQLEDWGILSRGRGSEESSP